MEGKNTAHYFFKKLITNFLIFGSGTKDDVLNLGTFFVVWGNLDLGTSLYGHGNLCRANSFEQVNLKTTRLSKAQIAVAYLSQC